MPLPGYCPPSPRARLPRPVAAVVKTAPSSHLTSTVHEPHSSALFTSAATRLPQARFVLATQTGDAAAVQSAPSRGQRPQFSALFFIHGATIAAWFVPLSPVLEAHGYLALRPYAFATSAIAALITPLIFGALADRQLPPVQVLRHACIAAAVLTALASLAIAHRAPAWMVYAAIQVQALVMVPTWSLLSSIVLAGLPDPRSQFGPVRAFGTFGWAAGCLLVSALGADLSTRSGAASTIGWILVAITTTAVPSIAPPTATEPVTLRQRFGIDAIGLLRNPDYRVVFLAAGLLAAPLAAFYPFAPSHLHDLGMVRTSAWMGLAQATEVVAMFGLAALLANWRLKTVLACGIGFAVLRYLLLSLDSIPTVLVGISLHGFAFTLFFIAAPITLNERIDPAWRTRAMALLSLMTQGFGNLIGYLGSGLWLAYCTQAGGRVQWPVFWSGLALLVVAVMAYFLAFFPAERRAPNPAS